MEASAIRRVAEDDPTRCQAMTSKGQCLNQSVLGGKSCVVHGGASTLRAQEASGLQNYHLTKFRAEIERQANAPAIKSLRDEIAILRASLEIRLNRCSDETELILQSGPISEMIMKIEKVVASCHKLEGAMGQLLDKQAILQFASEVITTINTTLTQYLTDGTSMTSDLRSEILGNLANGILGIVGKLGGENAKI